MGEDHERELSDNLSMRDEVSREEHLGWGGIELTLFALLLGTLGLSLALLLPLVPNGQRDLASVILGAAILLILVVGLAEKTTAVKAMGQLLEWKGRGVRR